MRPGIKKPDPYLSAGVALSVVMFVLYVFPGFLVPVSPHFDGVCRAVPLSASAEDLRIDPTNGLAYLTYYDRVQGPGSRSRPGSVMLVDPNATDPHVRAALTTEPPAFRPGGISLYTPASGPKRLFVVNRGDRGKHSIEVFEQSATGSFAPVETIQGKLLWSPTSIVAVGPRQFYVTNDLGLRDKDAEDVQRNADAKLRRNRASVLYFDGERMKFVATGLNLANGVDVSPDGRTLYVAETGKRRLQVFDRDVATGDLKPRDKVSLESAPQNISVDADGNVWISAHPKTISYMRALEDPSARSPTQVLKYTPGAERGKQISEVYVNGGDELSAGSVVAARGNRLVIGSVADHKLLLCTQEAAAVEAAKPAITGPERET